VDVERIAELRAWAGRLEGRDDNEELRAAGKAISMLVDEVEGLQARATVAAAGAPPPAGPEPEEAAPVEAAPEETDESNLRERLKRTLGFH
jgi:hypothetical protein